MTRAEGTEELRALALSLPEAWEDHPWGDHVVKVRTRIFAMLGPQTLGVKLPESAGYALNEPFVRPMGYGLGKHGWVHASWEGAARPPLALLSDWVVESYCAVAPKRLGRQVAEGRAAAG